MPTNYQRGRAFEYRARDALLKRGAAFVIRAAQSKGAADLAAFFAPQAEWAWAAGLYDGEGSTTVNRSGPSARQPDKVYEGFLMSMSQKDIRPLGRLQALLGGRISGPYESSSVHQWRLSGEAAKAAAAGIWPWLSEPKREQIEHVLEYLAQELPPTPLTGALLVQCKYSIHGSGSIPVVERKALFLLAKEAGCEPIIARPGKDGKGVVFERVDIRGKLSVVQNEEAP